MDKQYNPDGFIPKHGGYERLITYQKSEIIYDGTYYFCKKYFHPYDRTIDQMIQAARSGKQNIVEGNMASGTSKETEIKLTNVARASLEELLTDYKDFLRTRKLKIWDKNHSYYPKLRIRKFKRKIYLIRMVPQTFKPFPSFHVQAQFECVFVIDFLEICTNRKSLVSQC